MDDNALQQTQTDPQETLPPPAWDDVKAAPEFQQLDPNSQFTTYQRWRSETLQHASTFQDYNPDVQREFTQAQQPELERLATATGQYNFGHPDLQNHLQNVPTDQQPEGFWGTLGRSVATRAFPTVATVGGSVGAGLLATPETVGIGTLPAAVAGGAAAGIGAEALQKNLMGEDWFNKNQKQMEVNAQAHPIAHQIGTMLTFLASAAGGGEAAEGTRLMGKLISPDTLKQAAVDGSKLMPYLSGAGERMISGGAQFAKAGAVSATEDKGEITPQVIAEGAARNAVAGGALGLFPAAKTLLGTIVKGAVPDAAAMTLAGTLYDHVVDGQPLDWKKIADETKGNATSFAIMNGVMGLLHGTPLRIKSGELAPPDATQPITPDEEKVALDTRIKQLEEKQQAGQLTGGQDKQLEDLKKLQDLKGGSAPTALEAAPPVTPETPAAPATPEAAPAFRTLTAGERAISGAPEAAPAAELPQESKDLVTKVNEGLAAGEQPAATEGDRYVTRRISEGASPREAREEWEAEQQKNQPPAAEAAPQTPPPTPEERQAAEAQAKTLPTETLQQEISKPDSGYHDIIQAELDRRANAGTAAPIPEKPTEPAAPQTLEERIAAKTEAENAKARSIQDVEEKIPPDRPFPKDIVFTTRDRELAGKQMWLDHIQDPERDFKLPDLQKALGRDAGTALYKEMWGEPEGTRVGRMQPLDEARTAEEVPTQRAADEEKAAQATPELVKQAEASVEAPVTEAEKALHAAGVTDPKAFLDQVNERMRSAGKPELTMEDIAAKQIYGKEAGGQGTEAATAEGHKLDPIQKLQNTQKLSELGFYSNKENPIGEVIKNLRESGTPLEKLVANLLHNSGVDFSKVKTIVDDYLNARGRHEGRPNEQDYRISLNPSLPHGTKGIVGTLLHEAYHHVTVWKLQDAYVPNKYEAAAIKQLQGIMDTGRQAAFQEVFGRAPAKGEFDKFVGFLRAPNSEDSRKWLLSQPFPILNKLITSYDTYYGLSNLKETAAEITNPNFHDFVSNLPPTPTATGAFRTLLQQFNGWITKLVAGRPVPQMDRLRNYLEAAAALGVDAPRTRGVPGTELIPMMSSNEMVDKALHESGEELPKSPGKYASIMRSSGVPYIGNFLGTHEQMAKDAQEELAKNPNAAEERLKILADHKAVPSAEDFHLFRAKVSTLRQAEVAARIKGNIPAAQAARAAEENWMTQVYNKTAEAGKSLQAVQGALDINTGDFFDLRSYFKMVYGKDFTPKQEEQAQKIVQATTEARVETLKNSIKMGQEIAKTAEGTVNELGEAAKGTRLSSAEKKAAKAAGVETKKDPTGKDTGQLEFGFDYNPADAGKKLSQYLNARFEAKPYRIGQKNLTVREVGNIWKFIKANYLDGTEYIRPEELVNDVASDLKIDRRVVQEAISAPKTIRAFEAERYKAQAQQRAIVQATKTFMDNADKGKVLSNLAKLWELPRTVAVVGHVNPALTHAGSLLFRPLSAGKEEFAAIPQAFRAAFLGGKNEDGVKMDASAYHEKLMRQVMNAPDYAYLTKQGLAAKVGVLEDMGQYNNYLGRIGVAGNRGMDTLKALRMDLGQKEYKRLQGKDWFNNLDQTNKDQVVKEAMSRLNSETGTTTPGFTKIGNLLTGDWRTFLFAPRLEGARWQQMVVDPLRATGLFLKGTAATPAERYFRMAVLRRSAEMASTMVAALGVNAAILKAVNSDDKINWFDPTRSDWLAFKVHGQTVLAPSSFLAPLRLSLSVALSHVIPAENRQPYTDKIINYAMGKVTPSISDLVEIARAKQQYTGKPIEALQNLYENMGVKFSTPRNPKDPISLTHWALTKGPIPLAATVEGWSNAMDQQGIEPKLRDTIIGASLALVGSMFAVHQHPTPPEKNPNQ